MLPASAVCDELDDRNFVERFEALAISPRDFRHRDHVRLAFAMLDGADFGEAAVRFRRALRRFAANAGEAGKYHETLTWAYLAIIHERMTEHADATAHAFIERNPDLLDPAGALGRYYDVEQLFVSGLARRVFVLPRRR